MGLAVPYAGVVTRSIRAIGELAMITTIDESKSVGRCGNWARDVPLNVLRTTRRAVWPDWHAEYIVYEQASGPLPS
jgi:hypothetical protein